MAHPVLGQVLGIVPARGGSKGLPGKNTLSLAGAPLIAHAVAALGQVDHVDRTIVTTDDEQIAAVARGWGAEVPFRRPAELAADDTPMAPVLRHALLAAEEDGTTYGAVVLADPTSPLRRPEAISRAIDVLSSRDDLVGLVAVSEPLFHPSWVGVRLDDSGALARYYDDGHGVTRRQDNADRYLRINGSFYVWRAEFVRSMEGSWLDAGPHGGVEVDELHAFSIDDETEYRVVCALVDAGVVTLPWLPELLDRTPR